MSAASRSGAGSLTLWWLVLLLLQLLLMLLLLVPLLFQLFLPLLLLTSLLLAGLMSAALALHSVLLARLWFDSEGDAGSPVQKGCSKSSGTIRRQLCSAVVDMFAVTSDQILQMTVLCSRVYVSAVDSEAHLPMYLRRSLLMPCW